MTNTFTFKVTSKRMEEHLESQPNKSGYIRSLIEQDMLTQADEIERQLEEIEEERENIASREDELEAKEEQLRGQLEAAQETSVGVSDALVNFVENLITIPPDRREGRIRGQVRSSVPEVSPEEVVEAVDAIDLHHVDYSGHVGAETIEQEKYIAEEYRDTGLDESNFVMNDTTLTVEDNSTEEYEFVTSLMPRQRDELEEQLPEYF